MLLFLFIFFHYSGRHPACPVDRQPMGAVSKYVFVHFYFFMACRQVIGLVRIVVRMDNFKILSFFYFVFQVFNDRHCEREIGNLMVFCDSKPSCDWKGMLLHLDVSVVCDFSFL